MENGVKIFKKISNTCNLQKKIARWIPGSDSRKTLLNPGKMVSEKWSPGKEIPGKIEIKSKKYEQT